MRSPSGGEARHRGGTQVGKAPPSPEMTISGLTRGWLVGEDDVAKHFSFPGFTGRAARPSGGLFRFWALRLQRLSANHFAPSGIPHRSLSAVKRVGETATSHAALWRLRASGHARPLVQASLSILRPVPTAGQAVADRSTGTCLSPAPRSLSGADRAPSACRGFAHPSRRVVHVAAQFHAPRH